MYKKKMKRGRGKGTHARGKAAGKKVEKFSQEYSQESAWMGWTTFAEMVVLASIIKCHLKFIFH